MTTLPDVTIRPAKYWTDTRILVCKSVECIYNDDNECRLKHLNIDSKGRCSAYVTEQNPQYREQAKSGFWKTEAYEILSDSKFVTQRTISTLHGRFNRDAFDGSLTQLRAVASGNMYVRNIGEKSRKSFVIALAKYDKQKAGTQ